MAEEKKIILTSAGLASLEEELENLKVVRRKEVAAKIRKQGAQGDLSENADYMMLLRKSRLKLKPELLQ